MAADVLTLEGAFYDFDEGNDLGKQGRSFFVLGSWLFAALAGPGRLQPMARLQFAAPPGGGTGVRTIDAGLNYILDGHNARVGLALQNTTPPAGSSMTGVQLGVQIQE